MDRLEIELTLTRDRAGLLERVGALSPADLARGATDSAHDPASQWSALDHLAHLAGIERNFNAMIRAHLDGDARPVGIMRDNSGERRTMEQIMAAVNRMNEEWVVRHRGKSLAQVLALGETTRAETLALLGELTDDQLAQKVPDAPWADGTVGAIIATNGMHGRIHFAAVKAGLGEPA